jgi:hypothetical protein
VVLGARQVGKTTLMRRVAATIPGRVLWVDGDVAEPDHALSSRSPRRLADLVEGYEALLVDEAQRIPEIGINLKIIVDTMPGTRLLVSGSSSLDLASKIREPLTGRAWFHELHPVALAELYPAINREELRQSLEDRLVFGSYPEVVTHGSTSYRFDYLRTLVESYLFKDILDLSPVRSPEKVRDLLQLLAFQIGNQASLSELGTQLGLSKETVASYLDLLEQAFIVFRLKGFSRNLRKEVTKLDKVYFWDVGVRNAMIGNLNRLARRNDTGALWENFAISERAKLRSYSGSLGRQYFWRTYTGSEVDLIEDRDGSLHGYEVKWGSSRARGGDSFVQTYPQATLTMIRPDDLGPLLKH